MNFSFRTFGASTLEAVEILDVREIFAYLKFIQHDTTRPIALAAQVTRFGNFGGVNQIFLNKMIKEHEAWDLCKLRCRFFSVVGYRL